MRNPPLGLVLFALTLVSSSTLVLTPTLVSAHPKQFGLPTLTRADFNRLAIERALPLFWIADRDRDKQVDADELGGRGAGKPLAAFVRGGKLTARFKKAYKAMVEMRRREAVARELAAGRPTLVVSDFRKSPAWERRFVRALLAAAKIIDKLYYRQTGAYKYRRVLTRGDAASKSLFLRNSGPWCSAPATREDPFCNAVPSFPTRKSESYPQNEAQDKAMCERLRKSKDAKTLLDPFTVVRRVKGKLVAQPLTKAFGPMMRQVAARLLAAARAVKNVKTEQALYRYLVATAASFKSNDWSGADEAWSRMNSENSRFYLRIGPDEVYFDPCQQKAGFHVSMARIDPLSLVWKRKLVPLRQQMEESLAQLIGPSYKARKIKFDMPDFIHIVLNAGDSRHPLGATIGQSLPNWGKVARDGRRRTVVMSNLYTDADSRRISRIKAKTLLAPSSLAYYTDDPAPGQLDTILHEAGHNFGPDSSYLINGKRPKAIFGGPLASTLEELKAQTLSLFYTDFLQRKGILSEKQARQAYINAVMWAFGHISRGMTTSGGRPKPYSQLAAVQMGWLLERGAMTFKDGKFTVHFKKVVPAVRALMKRVGLIKAKGDAAGGQELISRYTSAAALAKLQYALLKRELLKHPKAAFGYAIYY
jgi:hypothetical protein